MGTIFSKRSKALGTNEKKVTKRSGKNNPRNEGSTTSLNDIDFEVSASPDPYAHEHIQNAKTHQTVPYSKPLPSVPVRRQNGGLEIKSQSLNNLLDQSNQRPAPPLTAKKPTKKPTAENERLYLEPRTSQIPDSEMDLKSEDDSDFDGYISVNFGKVDDDLGDTEESESSEYQELDWKPTMRADRTHESNSVRVISCEAGDILQLVVDGEINGMYLVKNLRTGEENFVPKVWVTMISSVDVESQKCFFKNIDRKAAEEKLQAAAIEIGTYLIRPSRADGYALSLRCKNKSCGMEIRHYKISVNKKGEFYIDPDSENTVFSDIVELIRYYTDKPGLQSKLKKPLPRDILLDDLALEFSDLKLGQKLGSGNFGFVYAGMLRKTKQVAVKSLIPGGSMKAEQFRKEAETMHKLRHPNLVCLLGICENGDQIYIVTEMMSKGALITLLREDSGNTISFKDLMYMAIQVLEGMCYLEMKGFVHRDLRAANVLVGDGHITKVADFGLARILDCYYGGEDYYQEKKGAAFPYKWTAPEAIKQLKFTVKSDVWCFGILLYEMVTHGDEPYAAMSNHEALKWVETGNRLERPTKQRCPLTLYNIMKSCWMLNPTDRPNFADIQETLTEIKALG